MDQHHRTLLLMMGSDLWASLMRRVKASAGHYLSCSQELVVGAQVGNQWLLETGLLANLTLGNWWGLENHL